MKLMPQDHKKKMYHCLLWINSLLKGILPKSAFLVIIKNVFKPQPALMLPNNKIERTQKSPCSFSTRTFFIYQKINNFYRLCFFNCSAFCCSALCCSSLLCCSSHS